MLRTAQLYKVQLEEEILKTWHDPDYMYYHSGTGSTVLQLAKNNYERHDFVSVNNDGKILGYISYNVSWCSMVASNFGIIRFDKQTFSKDFVIDILEVISNIFNKYNLNKIEWFCYADNPVIHSYRKFVQKYGGRECGYVRQSAKLIDGKLHDYALFELMKDEFLGFKNGQAV